MIQSNKPKRPSPEYIEKLAQRTKAWNRETEEANKFVFADLDTMLDHFMGEAYAGCHYEGFAHLERMKQYIKVIFPAKLKQELDYVKTLEP